jgi:tRNA U55 pseudouridine synthase TruB
MEGMLLLNVACRAEEYLNEVVSNLQTVFGLSGQVLELRPSDEDRNRIVIATKTRAGQSPENRERLLAKWIKVLPAY